MTWLHSAPIRDSSVLHGRTFYITQWQSEFRYKRSLDNLICSKCQGKAIFMSNELLCRGSRISMHSFYSGLVLNLYDSDSTSPLRTERQWCDLAMSLSLLSMCERGFKRLQECWECYSDKLTEPGVYQPLLSITAKLRRGAKTQFKVLHTSPFPSRCFVCVAKCCPGDTKTLQVCR